MDRFEGNTQASAETQASEIARLPVLVPTLVERSHLLLGAAVFAIGFYTLWRSINLVLDSSDVLSPEIWARLAFVTFVELGLFALGFFLMRQARRLEAERALIAAAERIDANPSMKLRVIADVAQRWADPKRNKARAKSDNNVAAMAAGRWVLDRFGEGSVVASVPAEVSNQKLRSLGGGDATIQVLRPGSSGGLP